MEKKSTIILLNLSNEITQLETLVNSVNNVNPAFKIIIKRLRDLNKNDCFFKQKTDKAFNAYQHIIDVLTDEMFAMSFDASRISFKNLLLFIQMCFTFQLRK